MNTARIRLMTFRRGWKAGACANVKEEALKDDADYLRGYAEGFEARSAAASKWLRDNGVTQEEAMLWVLR